MSGESLAKVWLVRGALSLLGLGAIAAIAVALQQQSASERGPRPIVWGQEPCAHCRMLIGEAGHAAQVVLRDGSAKSFDDPGCLMRYLEQAPDEVAETYFHHGREPRWLRAPEVFFVRGAQTPMGFGLVAADPGTPGALSWSQAVAEVRARGSHGEEGGR